VGPGLGTDVHRAEFVASKLTPFVADASLAKEYWPGRAAPNHKRHDTAEHDQGWCQYEDDAEIKRSLPKGKSCHPPFFGLTDANVLPQHNSIHPTRTVGTCFLRSLPPTSRRISCHGCFPGASTRVDSLGDADKP